ncbi:hypothetical protein ACFU98_30650 [Streptomyces sp. NPDC057575]|uniref:hypothetical protein n=1 Tax=unclassified Streptomyces TaxID=2593676 RepID=UPI00368C0C91
MRDHLGGLWRDEDFADWYPRDGRPGLSPAQLATVCVLQLLLGLPVMTPVQGQWRANLRCRRRAVERLDALPNPG